MAQRKKIPEILDLPQVINRRRQPLNLSSLARDFEKHLEHSGKKPQNIRQYREAVRRFVEYVGNVKPDQISEELVKVYFKNLSPSMRHVSAFKVGQFLRFVAKRLPVRVGGSASVPVPTSENNGALAPLDAFTLDKLVQQKQVTDDLITKLARQLIDHYLYFQSRLQGGLDSIEELYRLSDGCRELIQANLPLFMSLSAQGHNVHSIIDKGVRG